MDDGIFSLCDLPDELEDEARSSGQASNHDNQTHLDADLATSSLDLNPWCERCNNLRQELDKVHADHTVNYSMLKEKIIQTDKLIKKYNGKCQERDSVAKNLESVNSELERTQRERDSLATQLKSLLDEGEPRRKAMEKLEKQKEHLKKQIHDLEYKLKAVEVTLGQMNTVRREDTTKIDKLEKEQQTSKARMKDMESSLKKSEAALKRAQEDAAARREEIKTHRKATRKLQSGEEKRIAHYEAILIKHGLADAITARSGHHSCESAIVSNDFCEDWDETKSTSGSQINDEDIEHVFREMGVLGTPDLLLPILPALSPIPASPAPPPCDPDCPPDGMSEGEDGSEDEDSDTSGESDLEDVAGLLEGKLLQSSPEKSPAPSHNRDSLKPSPKLKKQLSMDQGGEVSMETDSDPIPEIPFKHFRSRNHSEVDLAPVQEGKFAIEDAHGKGGSGDIGVGIKRTDHADGDAKTTDCANELPADKFSEISTGESNINQNEQKGAISHDVDKEDVDGKSTSVRDRNTTPSNTREETSKESSSAKSGASSSHIKSLVNPRNMVTRRLRQAPEGLDADLLSRKKAQPIKYCRKRHNLENSEKVPDNNNVDKSDITPVADKSQRSPVTRSMSYPDVDKSSPAGGRSPRTRAVPGEFTEPTPSPHQNTRSRSRSLSGSRSTPVRVPLRRSPRIRQQSDSDLTVSIQDNNNKVKNVVLTTEQLDKDDHNLAEKDESKKSKTLKTESLAESLLGTLTDDSDNESSNTITVPSKDVPSTDSSFICDKLDNKDAPNFISGTGNRQDIDTEIVQEPIDQTEPCEGNDDHPIEHANKTGSDQVKEEHVNDTADPAHVHSTIVSDTCIEPTADVKPEAAKTVDLSPSHVDTCMDVSSTPTGTCNSGSDNHTTPTDQHDQDTEPTSKPDNTLKKNVFLSGFSSDAVSKTLPGDNDTDHKSHPVDDSHDADAGQRTMPPLLPKQTSTGFDISGELSDGNSMSPGFDFARSFTAPFREAEPNRVTRDSSGSSTPVTFTLGEEITKAEIGADETVPGSDHSDCELAPMVITEDIDRMVPSPLVTGLDDSFSSGAGSPASLTWVDELPEPISPLSDFAEDSDDVGATKCAESMSGKNTSSQSVPCIQSKHSVSAPTTNNQAMPSDPSLEVNNKKRRISKNMDLWVSAAKHMTEAESQTPDISRETLVIPKRRSHVKPQPATDKELSAVCAGTKSQSKPNAQPKAALPEARVDANIHVGSNEIAQLHSQQGQTGKLGVSDQDQVPKSETSKPQRKRSMSKNANLWTDIANKMDGDESTSVETDISRKGLVIPKRRPRSKSQKAVVLGSGAMATGSSEPEPLPTQDKICTRQSQAKTSMTETSLNTDHNSDSLPAGSNHGNKKVPAAVQLCPKKAIILLENSDLIRTRAHQKNSTLRPDYDKKMDESVSNTGNTSRDDFNQTDPETKSLPKSIVVNVNAASPSEEAPLTTQHTKEEEPHLANSKTTGSEPERKRSVSKNSNLWSDVAKKLNDTESNVPGTSNNMSATPKPGLQQSKEHAMKGPAPPGVSTRQTQAAKRSLTGSANERATGVPPPKSMKTRAFTHPDAPAHIFLTRKSKNNIEKCLSSIMYFDTVSPQDVATRLCDFKVPTQGVVNLMCNNLMHQSLEIVSLWHTRCQKENIDTTAPWLTKLELCYIKVLQTYNAIKENENILELFHVKAKWLLRQPLRPNFPTCGYLALGRMIIGLCRMEGCLERARVFVYDTVFSHGSMFAALTCMTAGVWPSVLQKKTGSPPVLRVLEYIIMAKSLQPIKEKHKMMITILGKLCGWQAPQLSRENLASQLLVSMQGALASAAQLDEHERALGLLAAHEPWMWCNNVLVLKHLWPVLQRWATKRGEDGGAATAEALVESTLRLLGLVVGHCPPESRAAARQTLMTLTNLLKTSKEQQVPAGIQKAAMYSVVRLSSFDPDLATNCLQMWLKTTESPTEADWELIQSCVEYYRDRLDPEQGSGRS